MGERLYQWTEGLYTGGKNAWLGAFMTHYSEGQLHLGWSGTLEPQWFFVGVGVEWHPAAGPPTFTLDGRRRMVADVFVQFPKIITRETP